MWAYMGALGLSNYEGIVSPSYNVYRLREPARMNHKYLDYLYRTPGHITEIRRFSKGVWESRMRLYPSEFFSMMTPAPPKAEQDQIVAFLSKEGTRLTALEDECRRTILVLQERRTALITVAVTGQIDVREWKASADEHARR
jgi:type I restriction enzyme S subunit